MSAAVASIALDPSRAYKLVDIQAGCDMRITRSFLDEKECRDLRPGQCILRYNQRRTMIRVFMGSADGWCGMITAWAKPGCKWSREIIANWMRNNANVDMKGIYEMAARVVEHKRAA